MRARLSVEQQEYMPLCDEVSLFGDSDGKNCFYLPTVNFSKRKLPFYYVKFIERQIIFVFVSFYFILKVAIL